MRTITIRPRRAPITGLALRILQEIEALEHGYALGGAYRVNRTVPRR
jgi:hypothetical protein